MAELFGFEIKRKDNTQPQIQSFVAPEENDGAMSIAAGGAYGQYVDLEGAAKNEAELVSRYRKMAMNPDVEIAVDDIVNEAIVSDQNEKVVDINLDFTKLSNNIKTKIRDEFDNVCRMLKMESKAYDVFRRWYIDGRIYFHIIIDERDPSAGIQELRYIDPRKIRKVKEIAKRKKGQVVVTDIKNEYYIFNEKGFNNKKTMVEIQPGMGNRSGIKISKDSISHTTSGIMDENNKLVIGHLHKAIKPLNQLQVLEDASVIYRISRAPERRIFYIDVGNLPKMKAEQYLRDMMTKHKNRLVYDAQTGEVRDDRKFMTMLEDFWLPRREGGRGTEITTLAGGTNLGEMDDVIYFQKKMYKSLNVPISRLEPEAGFTLGRASEISRDELKFSKFVGRLRLKFTEVFDSIMEKQVSLKGIMTMDEWRMMKDKINYDFVSDNHFAELKKTEILRERLQTLNDIDPFVGKYFSEAYIKKHVLNLNIEEIEDMEKQIGQEGQQDPDQEELG
tara:strand:+ start:2468 stop:3976 length:1509 start_codon:yes stop_codon:yes gene_type:complete